MTSSRLAWPLIFAAYFLVQMVIRLATGPAMELDEAEAFWFGRDLALGYNAQPPLYIWLQWGVFQFTGETLFGIALLKALLLWLSATLLFFMLAREVPQSEAAVAVVALGLLPQVVWESQRALANSVLTFALAICFVALLRRASVKAGSGWFAALGLSIGLGTVSKFNFVLVPAGFLLWPLLSGGRGRLPWRGLALALGIAAVIVVPVLAWIVFNPVLAGGSVHKLGLGSGGVIGARVKGLTSLVVAIVSFLAPAILVLGGLWLARDRRIAERPELVRFLAGGVATGLAVLVVGLVLSGTTEVKDRWLMPILWPLVPAAVLWLWPVLSQRQRRGLGIGAGLCWVAAMLALPYASLRDPGYRVGDFAGLEAAMAAVDPAPENVVSGMHWVLGNLALRNPDMPIVWAGKGGGPGLILAPPGDGVRIADRLGLVAGPAVIHEVVRGARVTVVEITPVAEP